MEEQVEDELGRFLLSLVQGEDGPGDGVVVVSTSEDLENHLNSIHSKLLSHRLLFKGTNIIHNKIQGVPEKIVHSDCFTPRVSQKKLCIAIALLPGH